MVCTTESAGACVRVRAGESLSVLSVLWGGLGVCESLGRQEGRRREGAQDGKEVQHVTETGACVDFENTKTNASKCWSQLYCPFFHPNLLPSPPSPPLFEGFTHT